MPGTRVIWKLMLVVKAPTWPGCTRRVSPGLEILDDELARELEPRRSLSAETFCSRKPLAAEDAGA